MSELYELADDLLVARRAKEEADDAAKAAGAAVKAAERELFGALVEAELEKITAYGYTFSLDTKRYYRASDPDALHAALENYGRGSIFRYTVNYQTLNATLRELAEQEGGELPGDVLAAVDTYDDGKVAVRKSR